MTDEEKLTIQEAITQARKEATNLQQQIKKYRDLADDTNCKNKLLIKVASYNNIPECCKIQLKERKVLKCNGKIYSLAWCNDSKRLVSGSQDGKLIVWNALTTEKLYTCSLTSQWVMSCAFSPSGKFVASGGLDNMCTIYKYFLY
jgi:guanine nucleotide-binding protein G(I)/G(S)/G(T) subunit beta-1